MNWVLVLSLFSAPDGNYIREFTSEKQCMVEMNKLIHKTRNDDNVKSLVCIPAVYAEN